MGQSRSDRHLFLVSAWKLIEHMDWADKLGCLENNNFSEIQEMRKDIKEMRDMNEHVLEYFLGDGRRQHAWMHKDEDGSTDASSTLGTKIGGRLDWVVLEAAVKRLLSNLPAPYFRPNLRLDRE